VQAVDAAPSSEHWNVAGVFEELNANVAEVWFVSAAGVEVSDVSSAVV
jgi:hypothetical protein